MNIIWKFIWKSLLLFFFFVSKKENKIFFQACQSSCQILFSTIGVKQIKLKENYLQPVAEFKQIRITFAILLKKENWTKKNVKGIQIIVAKS